MRFEDCPGVCHSSQQHGPDRAGLGVAAGRGRAGAGLAGRGLGAGGRRAGGGGPDHGPGHAAGRPPHLQLGRGDGDPLVAVRLEPRQAQVVPAVEVGVLAVREPPAALVVLRAVRVRGVAVAVRRRELHARLVVEGVGGVAAVARHAEPVAVLPRADHHLRVLGEPALAVDVAQLEAQLHAAVRREPVQRLVAQPELACGTERRNDG